MPLFRLDEVGVREIFPGLRARVLHGERLSESWVEVDRGASFPEHQHPHEQIVNVLVGTLELNMAGEWFTLRPGDVFVIPPHTPHAGRSEDGCRVLDLFAPVRDDYR